MIGFAKTLSDDPSWRIRYAVADKIADLGRYLGKQQAKVVLLPYFVKYLQDAESEVIIIFQTL